MCMQESAIVYKYLYTWGNNAKRATLKGRSCRSLVFGKKNSVLIEFENGQREVVSRYSIRARKPWTA